MKILMAALAGFALAACAGGAAMGQTTDQAAAAAAAAPCSAAEYRQMDFWVGEWDARWEEGGGTPAGQGVNRITRAYDNCVIQEDFDGGPATGNLIGHSVSTYVPALGKWRQTWVDNQGGYFALVGGQEGDKFVLVSLSVLPATPLAPVQRMVFEDITHDSFTWRWQRTADAGATWTDSWVIHYTRRAA